MRYLCHMAQNGVTGNEIQREHAINSFRRKISLLIVAKTVFVYTTISAFLLGIIILIIRVSLNLPIRPLLSGTVIIAIAAGYALFKSLKRLPALASVRAMLDEKGGFGGMLMAEESISLGTWGNRLPGIFIPAVRWRSKRQILSLCTSIIFVVGCSLVPVPKDVFVEPRPLDIGAQIDKLEAQVEVLKQEEYLDTSKAQTIEEKLEELKNSAAGEDPVKTWEALDHLKENISNTAKSAAENTLSTTERQAREQTLADALEHSPSSFTPEQRAEPMNELSKMMSEEFSKNPGLENQLPKELLDALKSSSLTPEQLKELSKILEKSKNKMAVDLDKLRKAELVDLKTVQICENKGKSDGEGLAAFINDHQGDMTVADAVIAFPQNQGGKGGVDRGRGDAPMTWTEGTQEQNAKFKEKTLPMNQFSSLKNTQVVGSSVSAPDQQGGDASNSGALGGSTAGGGSAFKQTMLPRHKNAVRKYFEK